MHCCKDSVNKDIKDIYQDINISDLLYLDTLIPLEEMLLFQDWKISAVEALEYGNLTLPQFLKADKDQNGFVIPSEFDSDLA